MIMRRMINQLLIFSITKDEKIYCISCSKYRKFEKPEISYLLEKKALSIIYWKCKNEDEELFKEEESTEILKILGLNENI